MNSTNILLSCTSVLLLVAFFLSLTRMNQEKKDNPSEIASLKREIEQLEEEHQQLQKPTQSLIFPKKSYDSPAPKVDEEVNANAKMAQIQERLDQLAEENSELRDDLANNSPPTEPVLDEVSEEEVLDSSEADSQAGRRARLIRTALLQATVQAWDADEWIIAIDPAARANFNIGDDLALRRNDGILCSFVVTSQLGGQYIGDLKSNLATGAPEIVPGDELIIPPAFDRQLN